MNGPILGKMVDSASMNMRIIFAMAEDFRCIGRLAWSGKWRMPATIQGGFECKTPLIAWRAGYYSVKAVGAGFNPNFLLLDAI
jgi:hypothetical protein